jgi:hypothetical protein
MDNGKQEEGGWKEKGREGVKAMWTKPAAGCVHNLDALSLFPSPTTQTSSNFTHVIE